MCFDIFPQLFSNLLEFFLNDFAEVEWKQGYTRPRRWGWEECSQVRREERIRTEIEVIGFKLSKCRMKGRKQKHEFGPEAWRLISGPRAKSNHQVLQLWLAKPMQECLWGVDRRTAWGRIVALIGCRVNGFVLMKKTVVMTSGSMICLLWLIEGWPCATLRVRHEIMRSPTPA